MKKKHNLTLEEWKRTPWVYFSEKLPEINQQICVEWAAPYEGETDCVWDGNLNVLVGECAAIKWKPVFIEV